MRSKRSTRRARVWALGSLGAALVACVAACGTETAQTTREPATLRTADAGSATSGCGPLASRIHVTQLDTGAAVVGGNDEFHPILVAPRAAGGSLLSWRGAADNSVFVAKLDRSDQIEKRPFISFPGNEVHSLLAADEGGGAVAVVADDPAIYSSDYCINASTPGNAYHCQKLELIRFDDAGSVSWRTSLTKPIKTNADGAIFISSEFEHTARLVWNGIWYGIYFRSAGTFVRQGQGIDRHPGDTLRFVDENGGMLAGGGWDFGGCTYSWAVRLAYAQGHFLAGCHGDRSPDALRLAVVDPVPNPTLKTALLLDGINPYYRALGDVVPIAGSSGYWFDYIAYENGVLRLHLARVNEGAAIQEDHVLAAAGNLDDVYPFRPYLAAYGAGQLLLGYVAQNKLWLALLSAASGALLEGPVAAGASIDWFADFVSDPNGDVVWARTPGNGSSRIQIVRVNACR